MNAPAPAAAFLPPVPPPGARPEAPLFIGPAFFNDPYPAYAALREAGPVLWSDEFFGGGWLITRHADVEAVLRDTQRFSARRTGGWVAGRGGREGGGEPGAARNRWPDLQPLFARALLFLDAPDHPRIRRVLQAGFQGDVLRRLAPAIERRVEALLDAVEESADTRFDAIAALARPLPASVMAELMDIAPDERGGFIAWSDDLATFIGAARPTAEQARRAQAALLALASCFERLAPQRRAAPGDDLFSRLLQAEAAGHICPGPELMAQCAMLLFAGHETTRHLLGNGLRALLAQPGAWQRLQREPALLPGAVRELLRFDSPVQYTGRRVITDCELHGQRLRRGDLVLALIGSANRDSQRHGANADQLDLTRASPGLLAFGAGPHACIGVSLTLLEAEIAFGALLRRFPQLQLTDEAPSSWNANAAYRGLQSLWVHSPARAHRAGINQLEMATPSPARGRGLG